MSADEQAGGGPVEVQVVVASDHQDAIDEVAAALAEAGLRAPSAQRGIGVVTGSVDDREQLEALRAVNGVEGVEESRSVGVPPPDSPIQ